MSRRLIGYFEVTAYNAETRNPIFQMIVKNAPGITLGDRMMAAINFAQEKAGFTTHYNSINVEWVCIIADVFDMEA